MTYSPEQHRAVQLENWRKFFHASLDAWIGIAEEWATYSEVDVRTKQTVVRCRECHQSIYFIDDPKWEPFLYNDEEILALKVAHIRQAHEMAKEKP